MRLTLFFTLLAASLLTFSACQETTAKPGDSSTVKADIQALENAWAAALNTQDLDALMALYTVDAVSMPDGEPALTGKDAIRKRQEREFAESPADLTYSFETLDVYGDENTVTETGKTTYKNAVGEITGTGKYIAIWKKQGDTYLCMREMYSNDSLPASTTTTVVTRHRVGDAAAWIAGHQDRLDLFAPAFRSYKAFQDVDDPNSVVLVMEVTDLELLGAIINDPKTADIKAKHTVLEPITMSTEINF